MLTIYTITYNEEFILPHFIKWYRDRFKDCKIVFYDNESTDRTQQIALEQGCEVIPYHTGNTLSDSKYLDIKNNVWKDAETDWVIVCDADEFLEIRPEDLNTNQTLFKSKGFNMCNVNGLKEIGNIRNGIEAHQYDKVICFNKKYIKEINYTAGCHGCNPIGDIIYSVKNPRLFHMKFIDEDLLVEKYKLYASRLSEENKRNMWGYHYQEQEQTIRESFKNHLQLAKIV